MTVPVKITSVCDQRPVISACEAKAVCVCLHVCFRVSVVYYIKLFLTTHKIKDREMQAVSSSMCYQWVYTISICLYTYSRTAVIPVVVHSGGGKLFSKLITEVIRFLKILSIQFVNLNSIHLKKTILM